MYAYKCVYKLHTHTHTHINFTIASQLELESLLSELEPLIRAPSVDPHMVEGKGQERPKAARRVSFIEASVLA